MFPGAMEADAHFGRPDGERAEEWARALAADVSKVVARFPEVDPDNVRHTLILLQQPPIERLRRSLLRARGNPMKSLQTIKQPSQV